jgi:hypothetical protein
VLALDVAVADQVAHHARAARGGGRPQQVLVQPQRLAGHGPVVNGQRGGELTRQRPPQRLLERRAGARRGGRAKHLAGARPQRVLDPLPRGGDGFHAAPMVLRSA